ncbi:hypothetical protein F443_17071 [Phytophthora nicotianae P1569]|uniref:Uncharacterized protein n=1 Tax=Phytophthora nicotianae P1569 TaxID=1317065 RepID=V9EFS6_PHYNI|nr:hypothetical protein F443_17071 [Phytophthora nicotianae P1569]
MMMLLDERLLIVPQNLARHSGSRAAAGIFVCMAYVLSMLWFCGGHKQTTLA